MLKWAVIFLIIAIVAALFGFTGIATAAAGIAVARTCAAVKFRPAR